MPHSVVSHCAHPTVPVDIWARCNSVSWDNSTLGLVVWIGIDSWLLWINLWVNSQATKHQGHFILVIMNCQVNSAKGFCMSESVQSRKLINYGISSEI